MTEEMLEILIGRYLDSEITPDQHRLLEAELDRVPEARRFMEQLQDLDRRAGAVVNSRVNDDGDSPADIFERAWQRRRPAARAAGWWRFAAGVAAGVIIGTGIFALLSGPAPEPGSPLQSMAAAGDNDMRVPEEPVRAVVPAMFDTDVIRTVDYYSFTDEAGGQWLIEALRENRVRPVASYRGL